MIRPIVRMTIIVNICLIHISIRVKNVYCYCKIIYARLITKQIRITVFDSPFVIKSVDLNTRLLQCGVDCNRCTNDICTTTPNKSTIVWNPIWVSATSGAIKTAATTLTPITCTVSTRPILGTRV